VWKHVAILIGTVLAFGFSLFMFRQAVGPSSPWMVLLLFLCFLGLAKVAEPIFVLKLPRVFREVRPWEARGRMYRALGVPGFGRLLRDTPLRLLNTTVYVGRGDRDPARILRQVESAEAIHFWAAIALVPYLMACIAAGRWNVLGAFVAIEVLGNAYPIMHLRSVRARVPRLLVRHIPLQLVHPGA
ncbi:MAG TPA: hypothetical protein VLL50_10920, partial [Usitatibacter sp.]|nr:hypothetical protein [Usitatibacter sp.]